MELPDDPPFGDELELPYDPRQDFDAALLGATFTDAAHAEDAFLAQFARWLSARGAGASERRAGIELARDALDFVGDPEGTWQALPIERWLAGNDSRVCPSRRELAGDLLRFLVDHGRLSLHGQRLLMRRIAALRPLATSVDPQLAA